MTKMFRARAIAGALLGVVLAVPASRAQAQGAVITGKVTTEFGQPLEGANVLITEMAISVGTNAQGDYTINLAAGRVQAQAVNLRVRSFGYVPQVRPIRITAGTQTFNFSLKQDVNRLSEVVVTGVTAGTQQKNLPFTVAHMDERELPVPGLSPLTELQGKVPGAQIVSATGRPGSEAAVLLRGPKSINGDGRGQSPLYIVDGVELQGTLADINPQDIESVEVVKGAAAASLYGSRAGNGVISITTKSGKSAGEGVRFSARTEYGMGDIERQFPLAERNFLMMDETHTRFCTSASGVVCGQTVDLAEEAKRVNELGGDFSLPPVIFVQDYGIASSPKKPLARTLFQINEFPTTYNPVGQMVTSGQFTNNTIDASGRSSGTSYFVSANNFWQQGSIRGLSGYKRNSLRVNVDQNVGSDWTFGARTYYARTWQDGLNQEDGTGFFRITRTPVGVNLLATDRFGRLYIRSNPLNQGSQNDNPLYSFENNNQQQAGDRFLGNFTTKYTPLSWLDFDANLSYDRTNTSGLLLQDKGFRTTNQSSANTGLINRYGGYGQSYNAAVNGQARKSWGSLNTRYTARYLYEQQDSLSQGLIGYTLAVGGLNASNNATQNFGISSITQSKRSIGIIGGVAADWKERYFFDALVRRDGSSLFGSNNRWANYGRGSLAWRVSDEAWWFLKPVNDFKLRASYGSAGGRPRFDAQYETYTIGTGGVLSPNTLGNKNLRPETTYETELGFDAEVLNKYGVNVTYAHDQTVDQILPVAPPASSGFNNQWLNAGTLDNKTWEASVNIPLIQQRNLTWSARVNYDRTRTYITKLDVPPYFAGTSNQATGSVFRFAQGERYATFYGRKFVTSCGELPSAFQSQCGGSGSAFQKNSDGYIVWVGQGNSTGDGVTKNLWNAVLPNAQAPWGVATNWGMAMILRDSTGAGQNVPLGNALPDYRIGVSQTFNYKRLFVYAQLDGSYGQYVWNEGRHWSLGDFMDREEDQTGKTIQTAKPIGYYWRAPFPDNGSGVGGFYDFLGVNSRTLEKASYAKLREVNVAYNVGPVRGVGDWTIGLIGRNLHTFTNYTGFDPETGITNATNSTSGSGAVNAVDNFQFPNPRTFTLSLSTKF